MTQITKRAFFSVSAMKQGRNFTRIHLTAEESGKPLWKRFIQSKKVLELRLAEFKRIWKPISITVSAISAFSLAYEFVQNYLRLSLPVIGLFTVTVILLLTVPVRAIRLIILRLLASVIDLLLLGTVTFTFWFAWKQYAAIEPQLLMLTAWLWFFYFVLFDWLLNGTLGKHALGLKVVYVRQSGFELGTSFIRTFLQFSLLLVGGVLFGRGLFVYRESLTRTFVETALGIAMISAIPISMFIFGGNRGLADALLGTAVDNRTNEVKPSSETIRRKLVHVTLLSLFSGMVIALFPFLSLRGVPSVKFQEWIRKELQGSQVDRATMDVFLKGLMNGLSDPSSSVKSVKIWNQSPVPIRYRATESVVTPYFDLKQEMRSDSKVPLVEIYLLRPSSTLRTKLMQNLVSTMAPTVRQPNQTEFVGLEFVTKDYFGLFYVVSFERMLLCMKNSNKTVIAFYAEVYGENSFEVGTSVEEIGWLFLGRLDSVKEAATLSPL